MQVPTAPFAGAADASHGSPTHVAADTTPKSHEVAPDGEYPESHVG